MTTGSGEDDWGRGRDAIGGVGIEAHGEEEVAVAAEEAIAEARKYQADTMIESKLVGQCITMVFIHKGVISNIVHEREILAPFLFSLHITFV